MAPGPAPVVLRPTPQQRAQFVGSNPDYFGDFYQRMTVHGSHGVKPIVNANCIVNTVNKLLTTMQEFFCFFLASC
jgi:hypothetical protein